MRQALPPSEFHRQYEDMVGAFRTHLSDATIRNAFFSQVDPFLRQCALGVWQSSAVSISPSHVEYYNAIYSPGTMPPSALYWELVSSVDGYTAFVVPAFFLQLCRFDRETRRDLSGRFVYDLSLILLLFASIDGQVSHKEATFIRQCIDTLSACRRDEGLAPSTHSVDLSAFISTQENTTPATPLPATTTSSAPTKETSPEEVAAPEPTLEELLAQLDSLTGLNQVKEEVHSLINLMKVRRLREKAGLPSPPLSLHMVFMGNPGTGKTTVARLLASLYKAIGVLSKGQLVEVDRQGLVAGFVGQTALKTGEAIQKALGGVLFIDEAYALTPEGGSSNDFGREAVEVLLKGMEDHRKDLVVIVAGYTQLMGQFISSNPGLESRFNRFFYFDDYTGQEMMEIFQSMCEKNGYHLPPESRERAAALLNHRYETRDENFGNARDVRNMFEKAVSRQANRLAPVSSPDKEMLMSLLPDDLEEDAL